MDGALVGSYRITGILSVGGMGSIYTAEHTLIGRTAAVKMLLPEFSRNRDIVERFFNEARATAAIRHPGIVEIFDFGYHTGGEAYLVMELLNGEPLSARLAREGMMYELIATGIIRSTIGALAAAHALGIVHRDLKPDNVFLVRDPDVPGGERPKLLDFGIAKLADTAHKSNATRTGVVMGTPKYMAPEQCRGIGGVDARADLYAIGCILYEMVAGRPPFIDEGSGELIAAHMMTKPESPRAWNPRVTAPLEAVIMRLLAKSPDDRYPSANEVLIALDGAVYDESARAAALITPAYMNSAGSSTPSGIPAQRGAQGAFGDHVKAGPQTPTTLSSAAGARKIAQQPARPRKGFVLGVASVLAAIAVAAVIGVWARGTAPQDSAQLGSPATTASPSHGLPATPATAASRPPATPAAHEAAPGFVPTSTAAPLPEGTSSLPAAAQPSPGAQPIAAAATDGAPSTELEPSQTNHPANVAPPATTGTDLTGLAAPTVAKPASRSGAAKAAKQGTVPTPRPDKPAATSNRPKLPELPKDLD
jgi:serine/threonine protein kinase